MPIITSMLDTDFYKLTMQQAVFKKFPDVEVEYTFKNRTKGIKLDYDTYVGKIIDETNHMNTLVPNIHDITYLKSLGFFSKGYIEFFKRFRFDNRDLDIYKGKGGELCIKIKGTWLNTIRWEVPLLSIISELYSNECNMHQPRYHKIRVERLQWKIESIENYNGKCNSSNLLKFIDFGGRRRASKVIQDITIKKLIQAIPNNFIGTSNVELAMLHQILAMGTMAHEHVEAMQQMPGCQLRDSQKYAFQVWADVYRGDLGIALSDTLGMDAFFNDFDMYFAKLFDGARHDSGSPDLWCNKLIAHYQSMEIDPMTKTAVFSDGLTFPEMIRLHKIFSGDINVSFGIGTNLTNDCGITPLQIVIKMTRCDGRPVAKISDSPGKQMCGDKEYLKYLASVFNIPKGRIGGEVKCV